MNSLFRAWKTITPRRLFLVDGLGAVLSASSLGLFLPAFERTVGLPTRVLYALAVLASGLAAGSLWNCWHNPRDWRT